MQPRVIATGILGLGLLFAGGACRSQKPAATAPPLAANTPPTSGVASPAGKIAMTVTEEGFVPSRVPAKKGQPITLSITRKTDHTCAREIVFEGQDGKTKLPLDQTVDVTYTPKASGELKFGCAMGMMVSGVLAVSD
jgi:plastocyanin domain-containing protein